MACEEVVQLPAWVDEIEWGADGLIPVITQEECTGDVLMFAWMNREALLRTVGLGEAVYYSRSRAQLWHKGETSGHVQRVRGIRVDCDKDVLLLTVSLDASPEPVACHTGRHSCFYSKLEGGAWRTVEPMVAKPGQHQAG